MKTASLFPPTAVERNQRRSPTVGQLKTKHAIWTARGTGEDPWAGFSLPHAKLALKGYLKGDETPWDIFGSYCRLLDEAGILLTASSEKKLVRAIIHGLPQSLRM